MNDYEQIQVCYSEKACLACQLIYEKHSQIKIKDGFAMRRWNGKFQYFLKGKWQSLK